MHNPLSTRTRSRTPKRSDGLPGDGRSRHRAATLGASGYAASVIHSTPAPHHRLRAHCFHIVRTTRAALSDPRDREGWPALRSGGGRVHRLLNLDANS